MTSGRVTRLAVLLCLLAALGWIFWTRGIPGGLSGPAATLKTPYKTELGWATREVAADIDEMGAFAHKRPIKSLDAGTLPQAPWEPAAFAGIAQAAFADAPAAATTPGAPELYEKLTAMDVSSLVEAGNTVSWALSSNMRDARAHESAALVLGAFAMREAADVFTDVRWALNRMTAHLAVAAVLRAGQPASPDGALANVILSVLSNQHTRAAGQLRHLGEGSPPEPLNAWVRALRMRLTQDWRTLPAPESATRLEKLEYFRAHRASVRRRRAMEAMLVVGEPVAPDFARIAQDSILGVEDSGDFIASAIESELAEAAQTHQLVRGRPMPAELNQGLNDRATRLVTTSPAVLPWGAWAEFYQRHIAMAIGMVDSYYRHSLGASDRAEEEKASLDHRLGQLTWFPLGTMRRTKGSAGTEADLAHVSRVVTLTTEAPEILTYRAWEWFQRGSMAEPVPQAMPKAAEWFAPPSAAIPYEAGIRHGNGLGITPPGLADVIAVASSDRELLVAATRGAPGDPVVIRARELLALRHDYDLRAIDTTLALADTDEERLALQRKACVLSSRDCAALATTLVYLGDEASAATEYERAFADPMMDGVALAADAGWLVDYYYRANRIAEANALAERAASSGSGNGIRIQGLMFERLGRLDDAEKAFAEIAGRYQNPAALLGFYYRRVEVNKDVAYAQKWEKWRSETFPQGLQREATTMTAAPATGVFVYKDSGYSRKAGMRAGDIIVGLEGWRVDNREQYYAINAFSDNPHMKLTIWRGTLVPIEADMPNRLFGTTLETHPMKGWIR